jgi:hypothetical protein
VTNHTVNTPIGFVGAIFGLCLLNACTPILPGDSWCIGDDCTVCSGWDCYNSFINLDHPLPKSPESRESVAQCSQSIDTVTRDQAIGHINILARIGVLSWGPARRWTYQESQAADEVVRQVKECMGKQRWIYCCKGRSCELRFSGASSGKWFCRRRPVDTPSSKVSNLDVSSWLTADLQTPEIDFRFAPPTPDIPRPTLDFRF